MKIYIKKIEGVNAPNRGSPVAAAYDVVATSEPKIVGVNGKDEEKTFWRSIDYIEYETGLYLAPSVITAHVLIYPRSSISKYNLVLANGVGLVDNDYRGMIICRFKYVWQPTDFYQFRNALVGTPNMDKIYKKGDKIAQLMVELSATMEFEWVDELPATVRGIGGFGSTDQKPPVFKEGVSDMATKFREANYVKYTPERKYEQVMREARKGQ